MDKVPAEVRDRYDKLQQKDLPSVVSPGDNDENDDAQDMDEDDSNGASVEQVSAQTLPHAPRPSRI